MRRSPLVALVLGAATMLPVGCGENPDLKAVREARENYRKAASLVSLAQASFVPTKEGLAKLGAQKSQDIPFDNADIKAAIEKSDLRAYRAALLTQAEGKLKSVIDVGPNSQRLAARQMLARLYVTLSTNDRIDAMIASDGTGDQTDRIHQYVLLVERVGKLIGRFSNDDKPAVEKLIKDQNAAEESLAKTKAEQTTLKAQAADLQTKIADLEKKRDEAFKKASALRAEAFPKKGQEAFDLSIKAIDNDREGHAAETQVATLKQELSMAQAKLAVVDRDVKLTEEWVAVAKGGIDSAATRQSKLKEFETTIKETTDKSGKQLADQFETLKKTYTDTVEAKLVRAAKHSQDAIDVLDKANNLADSTPERLALKLDQLGAAAERMHVLADAVVASGRVAVLSEQVGARAGQLIPTYAAPIAATLSDLKTKHEAFIADATKAGELVAKTLNEDALKGLKEDDKAGAAASTVVKSARKLYGDHAARIDRHKLGSATAASAPRPIDPPTTPVTPTAAGAADPAAAQAAMSAVFAGLADDKPQVLWDALPASYQKEINSLILQAASSVDAEVWAKSTSVMTKLVQVAKEKKQFILAHPMVAANLDDKMKAAVDKSWDDVVKLIDIVVNSDLKDLDKVKNLDVKAFLSTTGSAFMKQLGVVAAAVDEQGQFAGMKAMLKAAQFKGEASADGSVTLSSEGLPPQKFVQVEGKWVPEEMTREFPAMIAQAKAQFAVPADDAEKAKAKTQLMAFLTVTDGVLDKLIAAKDADEFALALQPLMAMIQALSPGAAPERN